MNVETIQELLRNYGETMKKVTVFEQFYENKKRIVREIYFLD